MFDIGWTEILIIAVVSLFIIGPKDIPKFLGYIGRVFAKIRLITSEFRETVDDAIKDSELEEIKKEISFSDSEISKNVNEAFNLKNIPRTTNNFQKADNDESKTFKKDISDETEKKNHNETDKQNKKNNNKTSQNFPTGLNPLQDKEKEDS